MTNESVYANDLFRWAIKAYQARLYTESASNLASWAKGRGVSNAHEVNGELWINTIAWLYRNGQYCTVGRLDTQAKVMRRAMLVWNSYALHLYQNNMRWDKLGFYRVEVEINPYDRRVMAVRAMLATPETVVTGVAVFLPTPQPVQLTLL